MVQTILVRRWSRNKAMPSPLLTHGEKNPQKIFPNGSTFPERITGKALQKISLSGG
jgi:hypothetical protein